MTQRSTRRLGRREFLKYAVAGSALANMSYARAARSARPDSDAQNVLFISVDDLRPQLGCYGNEYVHSPCIDALAESGVTFERAYCQLALCNPSRASLMTGLRPDTLGVHDLQTHFRDTVPDAVTLPQQFIQRGYHSHGLSKIYHPPLQDHASWTAPPWWPNDREMERAGLNLDERGPAWRSMDVPDEALPDGLTARRACDVMKRLKDEPFFLGVGFLKPHLPFTAPKRYFDLYPADSVPLAANPFPPEDVPRIALHNFGELRNYNNIPKEGPIPEDLARELVRAYCACVSYMDAQVGLLLGQLEELGLDDRTMVVLWGDHGYHLGGHGLWCKHTNFEEATHSPLIVRAPGRAKPGTRTDALVEFVDVYPSLCDLAGFEVPDGLEGVSFTPLFDAPGRPWKKAAFSQYPRGNPRTGIMGYSMRTDRHRYTEWRGLESDS